MKSEIEKWIENALADLRLLNYSLDPVEARRVLSAIQMRFVSGSPSVWWLGFKSIVSSYSSDNSKLSDFIDDPNAVGWFIPETEGRGELLYRLSALQVEAVVADCPFFEYYFLVVGEGLLIAETDHNQFLIVTPLLDSPQDK